MPSESNYQHIEIMDLGAVLSKIENFHSVGTPQILTMMKETMKIAEKFLPAFRLVFSNQVDLEGNDCVIALLDCDREKGGGNAAVGSRPFAIPPGWMYPAWYPYGFGYPFGGQGCGGDRMPSSPVVFGTDVGSNGGTGWFNGSGGGGASYPDPQAK